MLKVVLLLLFATLLFADIDAQIEAIQNASSNERFKLMNAFKEKLIKMREDERLEAIKKLQKHTNNKHAKLPTKRATLPDKTIQTLQENGNFQEEINQNSINTAVELENEQEEQKDDD